MSRLDAELVAHLQRDDMTAFDALYEKYHQAVYRNIFKFAKDAIAAEDLLQEVFSRLWEKRRDLDASQSVGGWLFVTSFNLSVNYSRKKLRQQVLHKKLFLSGADHDSTMALSVLGEEQYHLLEKAIEQLTPQRRLVVNLCKLEGKTYEEAAAQLRISRHTVKEHLSAAMISLNEYVRKNARHSYIPVLLMWMCNLGQ